MKIDGYYLIITNNDKNKTTKIKFETNEEKQWVQKFYLTKEKI